MHISCPSGSFINVISAFYGRLDLTTCQHRSMKSTSCSLPGATDAVRTICQDKTTCDVKGSLFSDPCRGTYKYMNVTYECRRKCSKLLSFSNISSKYLSCYVIYMLIYGSELSCISKSFILQFNIFTLFISHLFI